MRIGGKAPRRQAHSLRRRASHACLGSPPPRIVIGAAVRATRRRNRLSAISFPAGCSRRCTQDDTLRDLAGRHRRFLDHAERDAYLHTFVADYNHTRLRCLDYQAPAELLAKLTGHNTCAGGTKIDANASKIRSLRGACPRAGRGPDPWDRAQALRAKLVADIAALTAKAEAADAEGIDPQALPAEIARRDALKGKLDIACARLEAEAKARAAAEGPEDEVQKAADAAKTGRRGRPPKPPDETPPPDRQTNLTDPDSQLMRKSRRTTFARRPSPSPSAASPNRGAWR
jgi:hypothetical protein